MWLRGGDCVACRKNCCEQGLSVTIRVEIASEIRSFVPKEFGAILVTDIFLINIFFEIDFFVYCSVNLLVDNKITKSNFCLNLNE